MEERVPPANPGDHQHHYRTSSYEDDDEEIHDYYNVKDVSMDTYDDKKRKIISANSQPHATYIIQVAKDQIYRVPPPENAGIAERYRNLVQTDQSGRRQCGYWCLSIFFVVAFIISVIICVNHYTLNPKNPTFSIEHFTIKHPPPSKKNASPGFEVSLETSNPNNVNDIGFGQGSARLAYKGKEIGHGSFPALENESSGKTHVMEVALIASKGGLPKELQSQSNNHKKSKSLNFNMTMNIPLKMKTWLYTKKLNIRVGCDFEINNVGDNIKVLSQNCDIQ